MGPPTKGFLLVVLLAGCQAGGALAALSECQPKTSGDPNYRYQCRQNYKDICTCPGGAPCNFGGGAKGANVYCKTECLPDAKGQLQCVANGVSVCNCPSISPTCTPASRGASYCQKNPIQCALSGACGQAAGWCTCRGTQYCSPATNTCTYPDCSIGDGSGICSTGGNQIKTCECVGGICDVTTSYMCYGPNQINAPQKVCYDPNTNPPQTCGPVIKPDSKAQCACLTGCRTGGNCPPCIHDSASSPGAASDTGCIPDSGARWCKVDPSNFMNSKCVACLSDGTGCDGIYGERCDTSGVNPVCKPSCTGLASLVCDASDSTCLCPSATPYCVAGQCKSQCSNGIKDDGEADVDCGGSGSCPRCSINSNCAGNSDCASNTCISSKCALPECPLWDGEDGGVISGENSSVEWDCNVNCRCPQCSLCDSDGGCYDSQCAPCIHVTSLSAVADPGCTSNSGARWCKVDPSNVMNNKCVACLSDGRGCNTASGERCDTSGASPVCKPSCTGSGSLVCDASDSTCLCPSATPYCVAGQCKSQCSNGIKDDGEADVDCGGSGSCPRCSINSNCAGNSDCASGTCISSKCALSLPECPLWDGEVSSVITGENSSGEWDCNANCRCPQGTACDSDGGCTDICSSSLPTCPLWDGEDSSSGESSVTSGWECNVNCCCPQGTACDSDGGCY